jgi:hypothetical protein
VQRPDRSRRSSAVRRVFGLVAVVLLVACGPTPPPTATPSGVPGPPSVSPSGSPIAIDPAAGWHLVSLAGVAAPTRLSDVIATSSGFLADGATGQVGQTPIALHSTDGSTWTAERIAGDWTSPGDLLAWGDKVVAVGGGESSRCAHPSALDTWVRAADATWTEAPWDERFCVGAGPSTLLIHRDHPFLIGAGSGDVSYVMTSDDGLRWVIHEQAFGNVYPHSAVSDGSTLWVFGSSPDGRPLVLKSADGQAFEPPVAIAGLGPNASVQDALMLGDQVVVVISVGPEVGILRPDGSGGWQAEPATGLRGDQIARIVVAGNRLVALGNDENGTPLAWVSADGTDWSPLPLPAEAGNGTTFGDIAVANGMVVLVGQVTAPDGNSAGGAVWVGSSALLEP